MTATLTAPRFGVWAPVYGTWGARTHPVEVPDASYRRTRDLIVRAEELGFDSTLIAQHVLHPGGAEHDVLETWSTLAGLAEATSRVELIGAIKPLLFNPLVFAKTVANIEQIASDRVAINLVSGWFLPELEAIGLGDVTHGDRYEYSREWLDVVGRLWRGDAIESGLDGAVAAGAQLRPALERTPRVYLGGESEAARALAAAQADVFFLNGRPPQDAAEIIDDMRRRERKKPEPLQFGLSAFVIARESEEEAQHEFEYLQGLVDGSGQRDRTVGADPATAMFKVHEGVARVGTNGGTLAGLIGSYEQVAERITTFASLGIDLFMLQFQPLETEMERFAAHILPLFR
ncbi:monooxygenase [Mycolicibacterium sp. TY66]|uniref:LLM class flavin-dependent oxidoreductase n=1 Tax=Mycobacteriaceae TaxID=1762 RepID=UPI001BB38BF5|nr:MULTISPECIES: LLM class flavin-dependent oxidoreductase [unclassified Mycolicibacterium]BCI78865.1 monooxygenase [Mycolicibacterium sp. TY66]BCJ83474.1 monooxygenase [Mycolicibacterium sp. TY81]